MSPRRSILALALGCLILAVVLAGLGFRAWTIGTGRAAAYAGRALGDYGLALTAEGPASLTLLPVPRVSLARVRLTGSGPDRPRLAEGGALSVDLDVLGLLAGRAVAAGAVLDGARLSPDMEAWAGPLARASEQARAGIGRHPRRLGLTRARIAGVEGARDAGVRDSGVRDLDLDLDWPLWSAAADVRASLTWNGVPARLALTGLRPGDLAAGRATPFSVAATWPGGSLGADGTAEPARAGDPAPVLAGRARIETRSLAETLAWLGRAAPLAPLAGALSLDGTFRSAGRVVSWPSLRVALGGDAFEGAGSVDLGSGAAPRLSVQATLAAESLNLGPALAVLVRLFGPEPMPLALAPLTGGDLDLRLSAATARAGPVRVADLAASVLVREAAVEVAVNRARVQDGTLKGRVTLASAADPAETEAKAQGSLDRLDLGALLADLGAGRWVAGPAQGQFALESAGRDSAGLIARVGGRAALSIDGGAIAGLDLADVIHRNGAVAAGALARRNGRTAFERATLALRFADGVGEIVDSGLRGPSVGATLHGQVSLPERRLDAEVDLALRPPSDPARGLAFAVSGPWDGLAARPIPRGEGAEPPGRGGEATPPGALRAPAALDMPGTARAYAP